MAHKKAGGSTRNGRDSNPKYLGPKAYGDEFVTAGSILMRQRGTKFHAGDNTGLGRDHTIYAKIDGIVQYKQKGLPKRKFIEVVPVEEQA